MRPEPYPQPNRAISAALVAVISVAAAMIGVAHAMGFIAAGGVGFVLGASSTYGLTAVLVLAFSRQHGEGGRRFGAANFITTFRAGLACVLAGLLFAAKPGAEALHAVSLLALAAVALDGVDGWIARRSGLESAFGARFDMETDAFLILVLCGLLSAWSIASPAVLLIGAMRYLFVVAGAFMPRLGAPLPPSRYRKAVCAVQGVTLALALAPVWAQPVVEIAVGAALAALVWSFGRDIRYLLSAQPA